MSDEIKEKLDNLRIYTGREENGFISDIEYYITNLQQENEKLLKICADYDKQANDYKSRIEKANSYLSERNALFDERDELNKEIDRLNNIINKTIELTKNLLKTEDRGYYQILFKEILKSLGDKENED